MEARILGAVLRAESKVQCRFNTAYLSMSQLGASCPVPWPSALPRLWTFQKPPARAYLTPAHRPSVRATQRLIYIIATHKIINRIDRKFRVRI
jgi:hypothetical protein